MDKDEIAQRLRDCKQLLIKNKGGQQCGSRKDITIRNHELGFEVTVNMFRTQLANRELAENLHEAAIAAFIG